MSGYFVALGGEADDPIVRLIEQLHRDSTSKLWCVSLDDGQWHVREPEGPEDLKSGEWVLSRMGAAPSGKALYLIVMGEPKGSSFYVVSDKGKASLDPEFKDLVMSVSASELRDVAGAADISLPHRSNS